MINITVVVATTTHPSRVCPILTCLFFTLSETLSLLPSLYSLLQSSVYCRSYMVDGEIDRRENMVMHVPSEA